MPKQKAMRSCVCDLKIAFGRVPKPTMGTYILTLLSLHTDLCAVNTIVDYREPFVLILVTDNINTVTVLFMRSFDR